MKTKLFLAAALMTAALPASAQYLCSYTTYISDDDKFNSSGNSVISGYNKSSVAAILRQDRANLYVYGLGDRGDQADCVMRSKQQRAVFERLLNRGTISGSAIRRIIDGNPTVRVDLYRNYVNVSIY